MLTCDDERQYELPFAHRFYGNV